MTTFSKKVKFRRAIICFAFIIGFLFIFFTFVIFGLLLYPSLVVDCEILIDSEKQNSENEIQDSQIPFLSKTLHLMGICRDPYYDILKETSKLNNDKAKDPLKAAHPYLSTAECKCPSITIDESGHYIMKGNEVIDVEFRIGDKCICNGTEEIVDFKVNADENEKNNIESINKKDENRSHDLKDAHETKKTHHFDVHNDTFYTNEEKSVSELYDNQLLGMRKCQCPNKHKNIPVILDGSQNVNDTSNVELRTDNDCICPEMDDTNNNETTDRSENNIMIFGHTEEANDTNSEYLKETETESLNTEKTLENHNCICPKTQNMTYSIFNETQTNGHNHSKDFSTNEQCKCPDNHDIDKFDFYDTAHETEKSKPNSLKIEKCECPAEPSATYNETIIEKFGIKNIHGKCVCTDTSGVYNYSIGKTTNEGQEYYNDSLNTEEALDANNVYFNKSENGNERISVNNERCFCPKKHGINGDTLNRTIDEISNSGFKENNECKCPDPDILELNNFDLHDVTSKDPKTVLDILSSHECLCPKIPKLLENETKVENTQRGFKDADGKCVCPETFDFDEIHVNETDNIGENTTGYGVNTLNNLEEVTIGFSTLNNLEYVTTAADASYIGVETTTNGRRTDYELPLSYENKKEILNAKKFINSDGEEELQTTSFH